MFREVRKKQNEMSLEDTKEILKKSRRGVLAVNGDEGYPYAIPLNYLYDEERGKIYFHGARSGYKVEALRRSDKVCFTVYGDEKIKAEDWAPYVKSAVIFGRCHLLKHNAESLAFLKEFAMKYYPGVDMVMDEINATGSAVQMFEIDIEHISGKEVQEK